MTRHEYIINRLNELQMFDDDSDYGGNIGKWVCELSEVFSNQRHSGMSAAETLFIFNKLMDEYSNGKV